MEDGRAVAERTAGNDALEAHPAASDSELETIRDAVYRILEVIDDPRRDGLRETPKRVAAMLAELTRTEPFRLTCFPNTDGYDQMVVEDEIPFFSLCEHHMVPFFGSAKIAYIPSRQIVGLSKLARTLDHFSRGLQTQERITDKIADFLMDRLEPQGVGVQLRAEHLCMSMRGARKPGIKTITTALRGVFKSTPTREEFLHGC